MTKWAMALIAGVTIAVAQAPRNYLNEGIAAFKASRYAQAVELFQQAVNGSPADPVPHLYLATAYMSQFIPGADSPENQQLAVKAEREFQSILGLQPDNMQALESLAHLQFLRAQGSRAPAEKLRLFQEAEYWNQKIVSAHPNNKTAHYSLGVIAWAKSYAERMQARQRLGMRPEDPGPLPDAAVRTELRSRMGQGVDEGIRHLDRALELDPAYDDAMAYLNLLYRERADLYDTTAEYQRDIAIADTWVQRALETKKAKAQQYARGIPSGAAGIIGVIPSAAPPPPPPPPGGFAGQLNVPKQIRVGGVVQAAKLIDQPEPEYPALARQARVQGTVRFSAAVLKDGAVGNVSLVSGHPLLVPSATEAVRRYRYHPTFLNGEPIEVMTQIDVNFRLP